MANDSGAGVAAALVLPDGREYALPLAGLTLGRRADTDVMIDDPSVSRRHAAIMFRDGSYYIEDLGSSNGTMVNGKPVTGEVRLSDADVVQLGDAMLTVRVQSGPPLSKPPSSGPLSPLPRQATESIIAIVTADDTFGATGQQSAEGRLRIHSVGPVASPAGPSAELELSGVLDIETVEQFRQETGRLAEAGVLHFVVNLQALDYLDSSGLSAFVTLHRSVQPLGGTLSLRQVRPTVRGIIELTRLDRVFNVQ